MQKIVKQKLGTQDDKVLSLSQEDLILMIIVTYQFFFGISCL